jgi:hypothetical protein
VRVILQPKQTELLNVTDTGAAVWIGEGGSRGGSKSDAGRKVVLLRALKYPNTTHLIFRRKSNDLQENHIDKIKVDFPEFNKGWNMSLPVTLRLPNGSKVIFGYAQHEKDIEDFMGKEYLTVFADEGNQMTEKMHTKLSTCVRYSGIGPTPKYIIGFNPGNVGHAFLKRIFFDGPKDHTHYKDNERPTDYYFIHTFGWDNIEWSISPLATDGYTGNCMGKHCGTCAYCVYYSWSDTARFKFFVERTDYGRKLNSLPQSLRVGHLLGQMDKFAGQYFTDIEHSTRSLRGMDIKPWHPRWISIDWGRAHDSAAYWHAQDGNTTKTYREFIRSGTDSIRKSGGENATKDGSFGARALAQEIVDRSISHTMPDGTRVFEPIEAVYLSPDAYAKKTDENTVAEQINQVFRDNKWLVQCTSADNDRKGGWALMADMLEHEDWIICADCTALISTLPMLTKDEEDPEDCVKFDGDDSADAARYGIKSHLKGRKMPAKEQVEQTIADWKADGRLSDPTSEMMWRKCLQLKAQKASQGRRFAYKGLHARPSNFGGFVPGVNP